MLRCVKRLVRTSAVGSQELSEAGGAVLGENWDCIRAEPATCSFLLSGKDEITKEEGETSHLWCGVLSQRCGNGPMLRFISPSWGLSFINAVALKGGTTVNFILISSPADSHIWKPKYLLCWWYIGCLWTDVKPDIGWIRDLAGEEAGQ